MSKLAKALIAVAAAAGNAGGAGGAGGAGEPDPNFNQVSLLLNGDGTDGGQNNTYTDSSSSGHTITPAGTIEQGSVSPFGDNWSNYLDGTVEHLQLPVNSTLSFGAADFTIEGWMNVASIDGTYRCFYSVGSTVQIYARNGTIECYFNDTDNTSGYIVVNLQGPASSITANTWHYFTVVRNGTTFTAYVDGVAGTPITGVTAAVGTSARGAVVGNIQNSGGTFQYPFTGYISNLRIVKGTALYTSAFTPPTEPLTAIAGTSLLTCQSNYFVDNSTNALTITVSGTPEVTSFSPFASSAPITLAANGGSAYLNGLVNNAYLRTSGGATFSGDLTAECWVNCDFIDTPYGGIILDFRGGTVNNNPAIYAAVSGELNMYVNGTSYPSGVFILNDGQWHHVALVRSSGVYTLYVDGVSTTTASMATSFTAARFQIGEADVGSVNAFYGGYISNLRIVNGTAVYTTAFTPPTEPLTAISGTELLLNFEDAAIFDYAALSNLGTIGNADISTAVVKYGTGSLAFDGTGDYLTVYPEGDTNLDFGSGDFTVECWFYANSLSASSYAALMGFHDGPNTSSWAAYVRSNGVFFYGSAATLTGAGTVNTSTWHHFAASRSGSTIRVFLDGTQVDSDTVSGTYTTGGLLFKVGEDNAGSNPAFNGYIDDLRITKGLARYTANFTPPTSALPTF